MKQLFNTDNLQYAICMLATRLRERKWKLATGRFYEFQFTGINWKQDKCSFLAIVSIEPGCVAYRYLETNVADAMDCATGNLADCPSLRIKA